jgi:predicted acyltransferase
MPDKDIEASPKINPANTTNQRGRLLSIDALRGFDMIWILGAEGIFATLFVATGWPMFQTLALQMQHSTWHGITAYDLIFPLFIFLAGVSLGIAAKPMSLQSPDNAKRILFNSIKRLLLLIALGIIYNHGWGTGMPANLDDIRYASVLGRIGIAWFVAALLCWYVSEKLQWLVAISILLIYWLLLSLVEISGVGAGNYSASGALNVWFDQNLLPGITYKNQSIDPEGLLSNITSIVNALAGVFTGRYMIKNRNNPGTLLLVLSCIGVVVIVIGLCWDLVFPINKTLWTSSFVLVTVGWSILLLTVFYAVIDVLKLTRWATFFAVIGTNSIIIYLASSVIDWKYSSQSLFGGLVLQLPSNWQPLFVMIATIFLQWLLLYWLYTRKIFIKV